MPNSDLTIERERLEGRVEREKLRQTAKSREIAACTARARAVAGIKWDGYGWSRQDLFDA